MDKPKLLLAAPEYNREEAMRVIRLAKMLSKTFDVRMLPSARDWKLLINEFRVDEVVAQDFVGHCAYRAVAECTLLLCVYDGANIDNDVSAAQGASVAMGKPCYALQTDMRRALPMGNNPMLSVPLARKPFPSEMALRDWARKYRS